MVIFELSCSRAHRFEGWFDSADDFARQSKADLVHCPICDDAMVAIVPSAHVSVSKPSPPSAARPAGAPTATTTDAAMNLPADLMQKLREAIRSTENVGRAFPEEARKIHYEEVPARAIRGQASAEEAQELREEGIEFSSLPAFLSADGH